MKSETLIHEQEGITLKLEMTYREMLKAQSVRIKGKGLGDDQVDASMSYGDKQPHPTDVRVTITLNTRTKGIKLDSGEHTPPHSEEAKFTLTGPQVYTLIASLHKVMPDRQAHLHMPPYDS